MKVRPHRIKITGTVPIKQNGKFYELTNPVLEIDTGPDLEAYTTDPDVEPYLFLRFWMVDLLEQSGRIEVVSEAYKQRSKIATGKTARKTILEKILKGKGIKPITKPDIGPILGLVNDLKTHSHESYSHDNYKESIIGTLEMFIESWTKPEQPKAIKDLVEELRNTADTWAEKGNESQRRFDHGVAHGYAKAAKVIESATIADPPKGPLCNAFYELVDEIEDYVENAKSRNKKSGECRYGEGVLDGLNIVLTEAKGIKEAHEAESANPQGDALQDVIVKIAEEVVRRMKK